MSKPREFWIQFYSEDVVSVGFVTKKDSEDIEKGRSYHVREVLPNDEITSLHAALQMAKEGLEKISLHGIKLGGEMSYSDEALDEINLNIKLRWEFEMKCKDLERKLDIAHGKLEILRRYHFGDGSITREEITEVLGE